MPEKKLPSEPELDKINERLTAALATCRSMVTNYKSLLANDEEPLGGSAAEAESAAGDEENGE